MSVTGAASACPGVNVRLAAIYEDHATIGWRAFIQPRARRAPRGPCLRIVATTTTAMTSALHRITTVVPRYGRHWRGGWQRVDRNRTIQRRRVNWQFSVDSGVCQDGRADLDAARFLRSTRRLDIVVCNFMAVMGRTGLDVRGVADVHDVRARGARYVVATSFRLFGLVVAAASIGQSERRHRRHQKGADASR